MSAPPSKSGRIPGRAVQAERVLRIAARLAEPHTLDELAASEDVTDRTIRRDLEVIGRVHVVRRHGARIWIEGEVPHAR